MTRWVRVGLVGVVAALAVTGCGGGKSAVSGSVTVDGEPVDEGAIVFTPADGKERPVGGSIAGGKYAIDADRGLTAGNYKVEIMWNKKTGKRVKDVADTGEVKDERRQVLPAKFNTASTLTAEIGSGSNVKDFSLSTK